MNGLAVIAPTLSQLVPGLLAFGAAWLWLTLRPVATGEKQARVMGWWGALAGLMALAVPSVLRAVTLVLGLQNVSAEQRSFVLLSNLPVTALVLVLALAVLIACAAQREDPLRRSFAAAALFGVFVREAALLLFLGAALVFRLPL